MGIAQSLANTFEIPRRDPNSPLNQFVAQGQGGAPMGSVLGEPPTGIENVNQTTEAFYSKWSELETFAYDMKDRFGIDVTRPDFSSAEGMEAHKMYQQAMADIRYQGNRLTQSQKDLDVYNKAKASAHGHRTSYDGVTGEEVFDPNKVNMADLPDYGAVTDKDRYKRETQMMTQAAYDRRASNKATTKPKRTVAAQKRFDNAKAYQQQVTDTLGGDDQYMRNAGMTLDSKVSGFMLDKSEVSLDDLDKFITGGIDGIDKDTFYQVIKRNGKVMDIIDYSDMNAAANKVGDLIGFRSRPTSAELDEMLTEEEAIYPSGGSGNADDYESAGWGVLYDPKNFEIGDKEKGVRAEEALDLEVDRVAELVKTGEVAAGELQELIGKTVEGKKILEVKKRSWSAGVDLVMEGGKTVRLQDNEFGRGQIQHMLKQGQMSVEDYKKKYLK